MPVACAVLFDPVLQVAFLAVLPLLLAVAAPGAGGAADPATTILERFSRAEREDRGPGLAARATAQAAALPADGWWPDLPVSDSQWARWQPHQHLVRLAEIALAAGPGGPAAGDAGLEAALVRGLGAWDRLHPRSPNWWFNEIGCPLEAARILAARSAVDPAVPLRIVGEPLDHGQANTFTGQNLVWRARIALIAAAQRGDQAGIARAAASALATVVVGDGEGLQADGSFHQHGPQFMTGSYGRTWVEDLGGLSSLLAGTPWDLTPEQRDHLDLAALDGLAWWVRDGCIDPAAMGRSASRDRGHAAGSLARTARRMAAQAGPRAAAWTRLAEAADGTRATAVDGARHFWRSDASVVHRPGFSAGWLAATVRTQRVESINDEHLRGALHADGATWIRVRGDDARRLIPVADWGALPGTIAADATPLRPAGLTVPAESRFGGGVADGPRLVHGWDLARGDLVAQQAWFAVDQGLVVLAAGVRHPTARIHVAGPAAVVAPGDRLTGVLAGATAALDPGAAIIHRELAWIAIAGPWSARRSQRVGAWRDLNRVESATPIRAEVLAMDADLGVAPSGSTIAWAVLDAPGGVPPTPRFSILANRPEAQAIRDQDGAILAVFRQAGAVPGLDADGPAVVMVGPPGPARRVIASDPGRTGGPGRALTLVVDGRRVVLDLPGGAQAGAATMATLP